MDPDKRHAIILRIVQNGVVASLYYAITLVLMAIAVMGLVALGELIAVGIGYGIFMGLMRNRPFMNLLRPTRHQNAKW